MNDEKTQTPANENVVIDGDAAPEAPPAAAPAEEASADRLRELEAQLAEFKDQYLRAHAEMENIRRRAEQEISNKSKFAVQDFAKSLLSVADNLERALMAVPPEARENDEPTKNLVVGVELTRGELLAVFDRFGVKSVEAEGKLFDPNLHQAMMEMDNPSVTAGTVLQVMQDGYVLHGRLLRPAMVTVAKGGPKPGAESPANGKAVDETA